MMGWMIFALPVAALAFLALVLMLSSLRRFFIRRSQDKKKNYSRNDVLRRRK